MKFDTLQQGISFYENYARVSGFDTRLYSTKKRKSDGKISLKYFVCNKEGFRETKRRQSNCKKKRPLTRMGCNARITLKLINDQDNYIIFSFHEGHTHPLTTPNSAHHTKHSRNLTLAHKKYIMDNSRANIGATKSYRLMKEHVGGYQNMATSVTDFKNFQRDIRKRIRGKDAQILIENFKRKQEMCSSFFFKYEVDDKQHLKFFWADVIGKKNYASFGDVVSFDTTFSMNEYCMVFAPFTGVDNSKSCVTFAAALLYREDTESFVWLFEAFRDAMSACDPTSIIADQDPAMKIAIERVFDSSKTRHRLCMWHIMKKAPEKVGPTLAQNEDFMSEFCNCVWSKHTEPKEFDEVWDSILEKYDLINNTWLEYMFQIRQDWIPSYYRNMPMSGVMRTTFRSESENNFFGHFTTPHVTLLEIWMRYESAMESQRHKQSKLLSQSKNSKPQRKTPLDLEKHASELYTHTHCIL
ncbi:Protein FAR1-RELATED SEQUENCE 5 [Bienertia sinuspersici]